MPITLVSSYLSILLLIFYFLQLLYTYGSGLPPVSILIFSSVFSLPSFCILILRARFSAKPFLISFLLFYTYSSLSNLALAGPKLYKNLLSIDGGLILYLLLGLSFFSSFTYILRTTTRYSRRMYASFFFLVTSLYISFILASYYRFSTAVLSDGNFDRYTLGVEHGQYLFIQSTCTLLLLLYSLLQIPFTVFPPLTYRLASLWFRLFTFTSVSLSLSLILLIVGSNRGPLICLLIYLSTLLYPFLYQLAPFSTKVFFASLLGYINKPTNYIPKFLVTFCILVVIAASSVIFTYFTFAESLPYRFFQPSALLFSLTSRYQTIVNDFLELFFYSPIFGNPIVNQILHRDFPHSLPFSVLAFYGIFGFSLYAIGTYTYLRFLTHSSHILFYRTEKLCGSYYYHPSLLLFSSSIIALLSISDTLHAPPLNFLIGSIPFISLSRD